MARRIRFVVALAELFVDDVDVVELRAQADASMPASNNNVNSHYIL